MYILYRRMSLIPSGQQGPPGPPGPPGPGSTNDLATTLGYGNSTGGITIQANTAGQDGEITSDILNVSVLKPLDPLVLGYEIGIEADAVFPDATKIRFQGPAVIQSDTSEYKLVGVQQSTPSLGNVLSYNPTTGEVFYQADGGGSGTVISVNSGTNITVNNIDPVNPVVNLDISSPVNFNSESAINLNSITGATASILAITSDTDIVITANNPTNPAIVLNGRTNIQGELALTGLNTPLLAVGGVDPAGSTGQYLTSQGPGATPAWTTAPAAVGTVSAGSNISITGTATAPVVNLAISSTVDMNSNVIQEASLIIGNSSSALQLTPGTGQNLLLQDDTLQNAIIIPSGSTNVLINKDLDMTDKDITNVVDLRGSSTSDLNILPWSATENINLKNAGGTTKLQVTDTTVNVLDQLNMNTNVVAGVAALAGTSTLDLQITPGIGHSVYINDDTGAAKLNVSTGAVNVLTELDLNNNNITHSAGLGSMLMLASGNILELQDQQGTTIASVVLPGGGGAVNSVSAGTNISVTGTASDPVVNVDITTDLDMAGNNITNVATLGVQNLSQFNPITVTGGGFDLQNTAALYRTAAVVGSTTQPLNITAGVGQDLHLNDNIGNTKVAITTSATEVYNNIDMNANYIQEVSNITGTNNFGPGSRVLTLSATDGIGVYSSGVAKLGLDSPLTDLQIVVNNQTGSKGISLTPQNNPIYINGSAGLATQVLQSQGAGLPPIWASVGGGGGTITSVVGGDNIGITGTATDPVVNLLIGQNVIMNNHFITSCEGISGDSGTSRLTLGDLSMGTHIEIDASATNRITMNPDTLYLDMTGEIRLNNQPGVAGEVLTSQGAGLPPIWTAVSGGGVTNPLTADLDANNYRITNLDEITPGSSTDLDIALPGLGQLVIKNAGVGNVNLGGPNVAVFNAGGTTFPTILNAPTSLVSLADTSISNFKLLKEAFLNNAINLDGSIDITEPAYVPGALREKTISLPNIGAGTTYTTDPVKSITVDGKGRITSASSYLTGPVESVTAGIGISLTGTATNPQVNNNGVLSVNAAGGITIGGTAQNPTVQNDGVLSVSAGTGISLGGGSQNPQVINDGLLTATAGSGISVSPGQNPVIDNTGVLSLIAGSGISISGSTGNITVSATGGGGGSGNVFENSANNYSVAEASKTTISAGTISLGNNLANIVSAGAANTAIGQNSLSYAATPTGAAPQRCVALGSYAHQNLPAGAVFADTVVIGSYALEQGFGTQQGCVVIGHNAARNGYVGSGIAIGRFAGEFCNTGEDTIVGPYASRAVGGGFGNVAIGLSARDSGSSGSGNVCIGFQSGVNQQGDYNILIGAGVGQGGYGPATWTVSKTCVIGYQYDNPSTTSIDAFFMDMSDKTTATGGRAALWAASASKVQSSAPCFQVAGDEIVSGIFQGAASRIKTGVVSTVTPIPSTGYSTPAILSGRSFTYPYNHTLSSSSGTWKLKVSLKVSGIGVNHDLACYLEIYNNATAGTTNGFLFGSSYQQAAPHTTVNGIIQNTIQLEDVFSVGDFSQGDLLDINLYVSASSGAGVFFTGGNWVFEYKLVQE